jgi:hypothetical protein
MHFDPAKLRIFFGFARRRTAKIAAGTERPVIKQAARGSGFQRAETFIVERGHLLATAGVKSLFVQTLRRREAGLVSLNLRQSALHRVLFFQISTKHLTFAPL